MKVVVSTSSFATGSTHPIDVLQNHKCEVIFNPFQRKMTESEIASLLEKHNPDGLIAGTEPLTETVLRRASKLKIISRCGVGLDNIDLPAAQARNITVLHTKGPTAAVAELTVGLMLSVLRRIAEADRQVRSGVWKPLMGWLLSGKTVGIIGFGAIGQRLAKRFTGFGCRILVCDTADKEVEAARLGAQQVAMETLLELSDIITLHIPKLQAPLLGAAEFSRMKAGGVIINTSRGGAIDEAALLESLQKGKLAGAGLDVFAEEPYNGPLAQLPQVVITCHMGSYASETRIAMELESVENLLTVAAKVGLLK